MIISHTTAVTPAATTLSLEKVMIYDGKNR